MKIYPVKLEPVLKGAIWGGKRIPQIFGIGEMGESIAEAWMLTLRPDGTNIIENGDAKGITFEEYAKIIGEQNLYGQGHFPLLIKIIDAADKLSVQVHPDDVYAKQNGLDAGKTEMWYILDAKPGAVLVSGIKNGVSPLQIKDAAVAGECEKYLNYVPVKKGDCFFIPAGLVHAIGEGTLIAEIQQNSNTTYRLYDYERTDKDGNKRELHTEKASEVIKTEFDENEATVNKCIKDADGIKKTVLCGCEFFSVFDIKLESGKQELIEKQGKFLHVLCVSGSGRMEFDGEKYPICKGDSYFLPLSLCDGKLVSDDSLEVIVSGI